VVVVLTFNLTMKNYVIGRGPNKSIDYKVPQKSINRDEFENDSIEMPLKKYRNEENLSTTVN
jgi:hypothetical protein